MTILRAPKTKKTINKVWEFRGRHYKLVPWVPTENKKIPCYDCDLNNGDVQDNDEGDCIPKGVRYMYCKGYCYKEVDPLYADLLKVKEMEDAKGPQ